MEGPSELVGRELEWSAVRDWVEQSALSPSALLVSGEAGIGKTSVWSSAVELARSTGAHVLVTRAVEAEMPLGYAGLGDLLETVARDRLGDLPEPLAADLASALLLRTTDRPSAPLTVARAALLLLRQLSSSAPVVVAVDDVQWLDPASARVLAFVARRLSVEPVGFLVSLREGYVDPLQCSSALGDRARELGLEGLSLGATGRLVRSRVDPAASRRAVRTVHQLSGGNPFYALGLARAPVGGRLPASLREIADGQLAGVTGDVGDAIVWASVVGPASPRAFDDAPSLEHAVASGVLVLDDDQVRFAHPILAAAAYDGIAAPRRRALHRAAGERAEGLEAKARHLALATDGFDAAAATMLEEAARAAASRGAPEAAAELAHHASRLTPPEDVVSRQGRLVDEADYLTLAGDEPAASEVVGQVLASRPTGVVLVRALAHSALMARDPEVAVEHLERAAAEPLADEALAARTLARLAWQRGAWLGDVPRAYAEAQRAVELAELSGDAGALGAALTTAGLLGVFAGSASAEDYFRRALPFAESTPRAAGDPTPRVAYAHVLYWRGDWEGAERLLAEERQVATAFGDEGMLMRLAVFGGDFEWRRGRWDEAADLLDQAMDDARDYWRAMALLGRGFLLARRGDVSAVEDATAVAASPAAAGDPVVAAAAEFVLGLVAYDAGDQAAAADLLVRLPRAAEGAGSRALEFAVAVPEAVTALLEVGRVDDATELTDSLEARAPQLGVLGDAAVDLCRSLLSLSRGGTTEALDLAVSARQGFDGARAPWQLGHALLVEGSVLRRLGRRRDAAAPLERAAEIFAGLGAVPARRRAELELKRARPRPRSDAAPTAAERRVAALVAEGLTNKDVAARLFTSVATVEAHLTRLYAKLGVRSRTQLAREVAEGRLVIDHGQG